MQLRRIDILRSSRDSLEKKADRLLRKNTPKKKPNYKSKLTRKIEAKTKFNKMCAEHDKSMGFIRNF